MSVFDDCVSRDTLEGATNRAADLGFDRGVATVAVRMLKENMDIQLVSKLSGLSVEKLKKIYYWQPECEEN